MKKYVLVARLAIQDVFEYKFDFLLQSSKYAIMVLLMMLVWQAVERNGSPGFLTQQEIVSYFVLSAMIYTLSNFHPWYIEEDVRMGYLAKYLVKPVSPTLYYFSIGNCLKNGDFLNHVTFVWNVAKFFSSESWSAYSLLPADFYLLIPVADSYFYFVVLDY